MASAAVVVAAGERGWTEGLFSPLSRTKTVCRPTRRGDGEQGGGGEFSTPLSRTNPCLRPQRGKGWQKNFPHRFSAPAPVVRRTGGGDGAWQLKFSHPLHIPKS